VGRSNTHEMASWRCRDKTLVTTAAISSDREEGTVGRSRNTSEDDTKETLVVDHNKGVETSISERESVSVDRRSRSI
jgi:hypothetical protein